MAEHTYTTHKVTNRADRVVVAEEDFGIPKVIPRHASGFPVNPWKRTYEEMVAVAEADQLAAGVVKAGGETPPADVAAEPAGVTADLSSSSPEAVAHSSPAADIPEAHADVVVTAGHEGVQVTGPESLYLFEVVPPEAAAPVARRAPNPMAKQIRQVNASLQGLFEANGVVLEGAPTLPNTRRTKALPPEVANVKLAELLGMPAPAPAVAAEASLPVLGAAQRQNIPEVIRPVAVTIQVATAEEMELPSI